MLKRYWNFSSLFGRFKFFSIPSKTRVVFSYSLIAFFFYLGDGIMGYTAPAYIESSTHSALILGLIMSSSSVVGLLCDMTFSHFFHSKNHVFFSHAMFQVAFSFPLILWLLPTHPTTFLLAMAIWGIYYELVRFAHYNFIYEMLDHTQHAHGWGMLETGHGIGIIIGPILANLLLAENDGQSFIFALMAFGIGYGLLVIFEKFTLMRYLRGRHKDIQKDSDSKIKHTPLRIELRIWKLLGSKIWHLYLFTFVLFLLDSAMWTIGVLLSEQLKETTRWAFLLLPAYTIPYLLASIMAGRVAQHGSKKRISFIAALIGGSLLTLATLTLTGNWLILGVAMSALFICTAYPQLYAIYENYIGRLGEYSNDFIGLQSSALSLSYIIGPILAGFIAEQVGAQLGLGFFGALLALVALLMLVIVPRKIRIPHQKLDQVVGE